MLTGPVGIAIAAIAALAAGFISLYKTNDEFREKVDNALAKVKQAFSDMGEDSTYHRADKASLYEIAKRLATRV